MMYSNLRETDILGTNGTNNDVPGNSDNNTNANNAYFIICGDENKSKIENFSDEIEDIALYQSDIIQSEEIFVQRSTDSRKPSNKLTVIVEDQYDAPQPLATCSEENIVRDVEHNDNPILDNILTKIGSKLFKRPKIVTVKCSLIEKPEDFRIDDEVEPQSGYVSRFCSCFSFSKKQNKASKKSKQVSLIKQISKDSNGREKWDRKIEFLLAIIGFSVDLGNVWRFPKVVYDNGGGRFMIPYFIQLILCGLPLFYMELVLGQFHQTGVFTLWEKICPLFKGLAFASVVINILLAMFYNTVIAWAAYYLYLSFATVVPWKDCNNPWNTDCCFPLNQLNEIHNAKNTMESYYNITESGLIYRNTTKKLILFNKDYGPASLEDIQNIFNLSFLNLTSLVNTTKIPDGLHTIETWLQSYFVLSSYNHLLNVPSLPINDSFKEDIKFDSGVAPEFIDDYINSTFLNSSSGVYSIILNCSKFMTSPTQEFYSRYLTEMHRARGLEHIGKIKWEIAVSLFFVFLTVYFALWKGIKSAGKAVWITAIAPYIVMIILLIRGLTLEGSWDGIKFYLGVRDWYSILEYKVWIDAAAQIFFSLGPGFGTIIALASYNKKKNNVYKDALLTSFINCLTSVLSGFVVFTTLGHMAKVQGKTVENVISGGPGLVFVTYPQAISLMPAAPFWAVIFFFMLFTLGIDSTFGGLESVITGICDLYPKTIGKRRSLFVLGLVTFCYIAALPTVTYGGPYIVNLLDAFAVTPALFVIVALEVTGVMYFYGHKRFCDDIYEMLNFRPCLFWQICWRFISPAIVIAMLVITCNEIFKAPLTYGDDYVYMDLGEELKYVIVGVPLLLIIGYMPYKIYMTPGTLKERLLALTFEPKNRGIGRNDTVRTKQEEETGENILQMDNIQTNETQPNTIILVNMETASQKQAIRTTSL